MFTPAVGMGFNLSFPLKGKDVMHDYGISPAQAGVF